MQAERTEMEWQELACLAREMSERGRAWYMRVEVSEHNEETEATNA